MPPPASINERFLASLMASSQIIHDMRCKTVGKSSYRQTGIGPHRTGHHRAVSNVEVPVAKDLSVWIDDTLINGVSHRAATEGMDGNRLVERPERVIDKLRSQRSTNLFHLLPNTLVVIARRLHIPIQREQALFVQAHLTPWNVSAHTIQRQ